MKIWMYTDQCGDSRKQTRFKENESLLKKKSEDYKQLENEYQEITKQMEKTKEQYNTFERMVRNFQKSKMTQDIEYREEIKGYKTLLKQLETKLANNKKTQEKNDQSIQNYEVY